MDQNPPKEFRPPINLRIKFRSESLDQFIERYAVDVSRGGIFIRTREPLAVGTQLKLDFQFQNGSALMSGEGTVVWIREVDPNRASVPPGMGVRFDKLTPESQAVLEQLLTEKAKRERGGIPGSGTVGAGGMAVRRPSSMFAVLDPRAAGEAAAAKSPAGSGGTAATGIATATGANSPAPGDSARRDTVKPETPAYRPLGTARNPFSSAVASGSAPAGPHSEPGGPASPGMKPLAGLAAAGKPNTFSPQRRSTPVDTAAPFDDISDEPTQIAGRLPSFLTTDEEETAEARPVPAASIAATAKAANVAPVQSEPPRTKPSLDQLPQFAPDAAAKGPSAETKAPATSGDADLVRGTAPTPIVSPRPAISPTTASSVSGTDDTATAATAATAATEPAAGPSPEANAKRPPGRFKTPDSPATAGKPLSAGTASPAARPLPASWIAGSVLVLGAALFFIIRFFGSHSEGPSTAAPADPATPAGASVGPPTTTAAGEPNPVVPSPGAPTPDPAAPGVPGATGTAPGPSESPPGSATGTNANANAGPEPADRAAAAVEQRSASPSMAAASNMKAAVRHKPPHAPVQKEVPRELPTGGEPVAVAEAKAAEPVPAAAAPFKQDLPVAAAAATTPSAAEADATAHQIRITSKPVGADILLDGVPVGKTPASIGIADMNAPHALAIRKEGFESFEQMISASAAWTKGPKPSAGKPAIQVLKINAKLKQIGGAAPAGEGKPATPGTAAEPAGGGAPERVEGAKGERPLPSSTEDRNNAAEPTPP